MTYTEDINNYNDIVIGIDLGTRFSCVSIWRNKKLEIICDQFGNRTIPSVVSFYRSAKLIGHNALSMKEVNPSNTIYDIKRIIGKRMDDPSIEQIKKLISYEIIDDQTEYHNILIQLDTKDYTITHKKLYRPEEICSYILLEIKKMVKDYLQNNVTKTVITVPAYFNDSQRQATLDSAKIAGLDVLKIINEPTAAALAYGMGNKNNGNVIIYDLGAGTLDVSLIKINNGEFKTLAIGGNSHLGGEDIDYIIMNHILFEFKKQHKIKNFEINNLMKIKLKNNVENAKKILSYVDSTTICIDNFYNNERLYFILTREQFEILCNDLFIMCIKPLKDVLESAFMKIDDIDDIILVGGSTRIPKIRNLILNFFKNTKIKKLNCSLNPDEVVSAGASIYGYIMTHQEDPFSDNIILLDITPLSLGIETLQKQMTVIIPRNTVIPTNKSKIFTTDTDDQDTVTIKIYEGERKLTKNNFHVGTFDLTGFTKGPRGYPIIKITFHIDINGILHVTAHEKKSDIKNTIKITSTWGAKGRLSKNEIDEIIKEAHENEQLDLIYSLKIGLIHKLTNICDAILINLNDDGFNLTEMDKKKIRMDIKNNLKWIKEKDFLELDVLELEEREKRLSKMYTPLIALINKDNNQFKENMHSINVANIYGDDEDNDHEKYENIKITYDPSEYDKEEIKQLKNIISELCENILNITNNPISNISNEDIELITDYIGSVNIWLYTTNANTTIEFVSKIKEINNFTENIMEKYNNNIFDENNNFCIKDELQITCLTLNTSLKSSFFSLKESDIEFLTKKINDTINWLSSHQNEEYNIYKNKLDEINHICNNIYHNMHNIKILENMPLSDIISDNESDNELNKENDILINGKNKINEHIDILLEKMPDDIFNQSKENLLKPQYTEINKNISQNDELNESCKQCFMANSNIFFNNTQNDILLKIDMNKLNSGTILKYKN